MHFSRNIDIYLDRLPANRGGGLHMKIQDLGLEDRPRERLIGKGPWSLSNSELLAVILRTGTGKENAVDVAATCWPRPEEASRNSHPWGWTG